jgi:hypothetical protein
VLPPLAMPLAVVFFFFFFLSHAVERRKHGPC